MWRIGIAFLAGHCIIHGMAALPAWSWSGVLAAVAALAMCFRRALLVALCLGMGWAWLNAAARLADDLSIALEGEDVLVRGVIASIPERRGADTQFLFDVTEAPSGVPHRVRLAWYNTMLHPQPGELWQFLVRLKRRSGFANGGGFDYEGYLFREGIGATGYVRESERNARLASASSSHLVTQARAWIAERIAAATRRDTMLGILQGLAVGETQAMRAEQWRTLAATGTTHLMAISGLHIGMLAAAAAWLGGRVARIKTAQSRRLTAVHGQVCAGVCAAIAYSLLAGLSIPTQRTLVMLSVYFLARAMRRQMSAGHAFGLALIGVLLVDPFAPLAAGTWLSFGAVAVILITLAGRLHREGTIAGFGRVQGAITVGLLPPLIATFGSVSLVSPLANALAVPFFTIVAVPLILFGALLACVWPAAGGVVLDVATVLLERCWSLLEWFAGLPVALWHFPQLPMSAHVALAAGVLLFILPGIWPTRIVAAVLCVPALAHHPGTPPQGEFELAVLDVGQGLATVVRTRSHVLVYDTGPGFRTGRDAGELVVVPYLHHRGVRRIDALIVSHGDLDHRGGTGSLLAALPVDKIMAGPSVEASRISVDGKGRTAADFGFTVCRRGERWVWDGVVFEMLHPQAGMNLGDNESSCVVRVQGAGGSVLLTGDIEQGGEGALIAAGLPQTDIVVAPHHGSRTSSTMDFVRLAQADIVVFAAGYRNRWGLPKHDVVERWQTAGATAFSTIESGALEVTIHSDGVGRVREHRRDAARYWHRR